MIIMYHPDMDLFNIIFLYSQLKYKIDIPFINNSETFFAATNLYLRNSYKLHKVYLLREKLLIHTHQIDKYLSTLFPVSHVSL